MLCLGLAAFFAASVAPALAQDANSSQADLIARGRNIATAADCSACHTAPGANSAKMAGGYVISSPLGDIISSNITPSKTAGIGNYSEQDFARAVRQGIAKDGGHLYPAMPYTAYARISDDDIHALYTYFMHDVQPVDVPAPQTKLPFPFNIRATMIGWNLLFSPDSLPALTVAEGALTDQEKRGEYLANALAHCGTCHTPRNIAMAPINAQALAGGDVGTWYAPNITSDAKAGIGGWSDDEIAQYLKTGRAEGRAQAAGPMAEAIEHSLQHLDDGDIHAIVAYLRKVKPVADASVDRSAVGALHSDDDVVRGTDVASGQPVTGDDVGATLFSGNCAACHTPSGQGGFEQFYPSLVHNSVVGSINPKNLVSAILFGVNRTVAGHEVFMPSFGPGGYTNHLSYDDIAHLANYVTAKFGPGDAKLTADDVRTIAEGGPKSAMFYVGQYSIHALVVILVILFGLIVLWRTRRAGKGVA